MIHKKEIANYKLIEKELEKLVRKDVRKISKQKVLDVYYLVMGIRKASEWQVEKSMVAMRKEFVEHLEDLNRRDNEKLSFWDKVVRWLQPECPKCRKGKLQHGNEDLVGENNTIEVPVLVCDKCGYTLI